LELLIVIGIIIILAASLALGVLGILARSEDARAEANILAIESAIRQYLEDWKALPPAGTGPGQVPVITGVPPYSFSEISATNIAWATILEQTALIGINPIRWTVGPYITPNRGLIKDPTGFYSDPWNFPYIIKTPGLNHATDPIPGFNNANWIDIWSTGRNNLYDTLPDDDDDITNYRATTK
jgi:type II secretory pathway pseudopilin PulG